MDKLTASLEIIKFVAKNQSFEQLNISQKTKEILDNFRDLYYNQIPEEVTDIDIVELNLIGSDPENKDKNSGGKDDTFRPSSKSELLFTDVIIGAATGEGGCGGKDGDGCGGKSGLQAMSLDSSSNLEILSTDVIITGRLSKQVGLGDDDQIIESFSTGGKNKLPMNITITGSLSLSEVETKGGSELGRPKFLLPTDVAIPELRLTDVVIFKAKGGGSTLPGGKKLPPL